MSPRDLPHPTDVELEILNVLWNRGSSTVREVHNELLRERDTGYSTTLKMMQVMREKGLLKRDDSVRPQVYRPVESQEKTQLRLLDRLVQGAFGGAMSRLLVRALSDHRASASELAEIKQLIRDAEQSDRSHEHFFALDNVRAGRRARGVDAHPFDLAIHVFIRSARSDHASDQRPNGQFTVHRLRSRVGHDGYGGDSDVSDFASRTGGGFSAR